MKEIQLTRGKVALVDDDDYDFLNQWKWHTQSGDKIGRLFYAVRQENKKVVRMHRVLLGITDSSMEVDHIDHDGLNNQRLNLRIATHQENSRNQRVRSDSNTKYKGVWYSKAHDQYFASIRIGIGPVKLGMFFNVNDAARAYNFAASLIYGQFAVLNEIDETYEGVELLRRINAKRRKGNSKYRGVHWCKTNKRWFAAIKVNKKRISLGGYSSEDEAAKAYNEAALRLLGDAAFLNIIS